MNWLLPTPVSPIVRKCLLSSRRWMRSGFIRGRSSLFMDMQSEPIAFRHSIKLAEAEQIRSAQLNAFACSLTALKIQNESGKEQAQADTGTKRQRRLEDLSKLATHIDLVL